MHARKVDFDSIIINKPLGNIVPEQVNAIIDIYVSFSVLSKFTKTLLLLIITKNILSGQASLTVDTFKEGVVITFGRFEELLSHVIIGWTFI